MASKATAAPTGGNIVQRRPAESAGLTGAGITGVLVGLGVPQEVIDIVGIVSAVVPLLVTAWKSLGGFDGIRKFLLEG